MKKTKKSVIKAAKEEKCVSYKQIADENNLEWNKVRFLMNTHLGLLIEYSYYKNWPFLTAIIVNKKNVSTHRMEPETLKGFITAVKDLNCPIDSVAEEFLEKQQKRVFEWAKSQSL